jgi:hypothetical protein
MQRVELKSLGQIGTDIYNITDVRVFYFLFFILGWAGVRCQWDYRKCPGHHTTPTRVKLACTSTYIDLESPTQVRSNYKLKPWRLKM